MKVPDLNSRTSTADEANRTYVGDVTDLPLVDGTFRCFATVIDLCSRRLAGWAIAEHQRADLVVDALKAAERTRGSLAGTVMHTDPGAQYRSDSSKRLPGPQSVHSPQCCHGVRTTALRFAFRRSDNGVQQSEPPRCRGLIASFTTREESSVRSSPAATGHARACKFRSLFHELALAAFRQDFAIENLICGCVLWTGRGQR
ncbi:hypothetical protein AQJ11_13320 [Streptomyces corchorusii]|uniref:Integrase catalytic domain-containing protein n=2 Tax=Streptomyces TaxID=1883 RepID=A0A117QHE7_STRCK|nr:DDE-type integrase/transposase/recombinase [Streptomyces corchorusii]KUN28481.1 hypothetical protein AQJ11_13320 [Streptomyces corchorusii]